MSFAWRAIYSDGSDLNQYENGKENSWGKIEKDRLLFFDLLGPNMDIEDKTVYLHRCHLYNGRRLIYRRRVMIEEQTGNQTVVYLIGWQKNINGENIQSISYIHEDGRVLSSGAWNELPEPYSPPTPLPEDK